MIQLRSLFVKLYCAALIIQIFLLYIFFQEYWVML